MENMGLMTKNKLDDSNDIFESFTSSDDITPTNSFGLVVLKRLVLAHNGTIDAKRYDGQTTIEITLPVEEI